MGEDCAIAETPKPNVAVDPERIVSSVDAVRTTVSGRAGVGINAVVALACSGHTSRLLDGLE